MSVVFQEKRSYGQIISFGIERPPLTPEQLQERKKSQAAFQTEMKKKFDSFMASDSSDMKAIRKQLSSNSQRVLNQIKNGYSNVNRDDWYNLTYELKNLNVISEDDFINANPASFTPVGDYDENGNWVNFPPPSEEMERLLGSGSNFDPYHNQVVGETDERFGDPLKFLDAWMAARENWLDEIVRREDTNYQRSIPLMQKHVQSCKNSCQKVSALIKKMSTL